MKKTATEDLTFYEMLVIVDALDKTYWMIDPRIDEYRTARRVRERMARRIRPMLDIEEYYLSDKISANDYYGETFSKEPEEEQS